MTNSEANSICLEKRCFKQFISLGSFCSTALELQRMNLRSAAYPFDWIISDFNSIFDLIENHFENFLNYELLVQDSNHHEYYKNKKYNIFFFHDFDKYKSLKEQLENVYNKYQRRIDRFYSDIKNPTLFIRYISTKKLESTGEEEITWIENNYLYIKMLGSKHKQHHV